MARIILIESDGTRRVFVPESTGGRSEQSTQAIDLSEPKTVAPKVVQPASTPAASDDSSEELADIATVEEPTEAATPAPQDTPHKLAEPDEEVVNQSPDVSPRWSLGMTEKGTPIHFAPVGTGIWTVAVHRGEARLAFTHFKGDSKPFDCDACKSAGKAKARAFVYTKEMVKSRVDDVPLRRWSETWIDELTRRVPQIQVGESVYRYAPKRTRRELDALVVHYKKGWKDFLQLRMWQREGQAEGAHFVVAHYENTQLMGWYETSLDREAFGELANIALTLPPWQQLTWIEDKAGNLSAVYGTKYFEIIKGDETSHLQVRKGRGKKVYALRCGDLEDLKRNALTYLHIRESSRVSETAKKALASETTAPAPTDTPEKSQAKPKPAKSEAKPKPAKAEPKPAEEPEPDKPKSEKPKPDKPAKKVTKKAAKKKTTTRRKSSGKSTKPKESKPAKPAPEPKNDADALTDDQPIDDAKRQLLLDRLDEAFKSGDAVPAVAE